MSKKHTPRELMYDLVSIQSDTFTKQEVTLAMHIVELIEEQDYFKAHPEYFGVFDGGDSLGRVIPWALRRGTTSRTVVLTGHFDCVEIDSYGPLKPYALSPDLLKAEMLKMDYTGDVLEDLRDDRWVFGRGVADMKGGDACILYELFKHAEEGLCPEVNILYVGVHDEEHQGEGAMQAATLMNELKDRYGLDFKLYVNPEPASRNNPREYVYMDGSIGKVLPGIVVKGRLAHVCDIMNGLNSTLIAANIVRRIELNTDFCCRDFGVETPPPVVLCLKDSKREYNVSIPNYTEIYVHMPLTKNRPLAEVYEKLQAVAQDAANETLEVYGRACSALGLAEGARADFTIRVMTFAELEEICRAQDSGYDEQKAALIEEKKTLLDSGAQLIQNIGFDIMENAAEWSKIEDPMIVIGLLPPYVPAVNNHYLPGFDREGMIEAVRNLLEEKFGLGLEVQPYCMGMSDNSYVSCTETEKDIEAMKNLVTPKVLYGIPFEEIANIAAPSIIVAPWGKDFHAATERVYLPDIDETTPAVIEEIIRNI
jgi:arginine utilization protein RocB